ncbi:radical SAM protein [bacterium]|nr:radical SAM protein [bacterium]
MKKHLHFDLVFQSRLVEPTYLWCLYCGHVSLIRESGGMMHGWQHLRAEDLDAIARGIEDGRVYGGPYHIQLDWVDDCNARCFFSASTEVHSDQKLTWERTRQLLDEARAGGLRSLRLAGGGEPMLHPNFGELAQWLETSDVVLDQVNTNGTMLTDSRIAALMRPRVGELHVSLNFSDPKLYAEGMGLPERTFDRVCEGIARLNEARKREGSRFGKLSIQFFVYKPTINQIVPAYRLGRRLGADRISFMELYNIDPALQYDETDVPAIAAQMKEVFQEDLTEGRAENLLWSRGAGPAILAVQNELRPEVPPLEVDVQTRYCYIAWYSMTIIGSEAVYPCCYLFDDPAGRPLDDLRNRSLSEVWRGPHYTRLRGEFRRWYLLKARVPMFSRRMRHMKFMCASHTGCPMSISLADDAFYAAMDARLAPIRNRLSTRIKTLPDRLGRIILDQLK